MSKVAEVVFLSGDLMFASRVQAAAQAAGYRFQLAGQLPTEGEGEPRWIILDLATRAKLLPDIVEAGRRQFPEARWIAYGPHVQAAKLRAARDANIETVLTRGQFDASLPSLFSDA